MTAPSLTQFQLGVTVITADMLNTMVQSCDNFVQLRNFVGTAGMQVFARGQTTANDSYQGNFKWTTGLSSPTDDNLNTIVPYGVTTAAWTRITDVPNTGQSWTNVGTTPGRLLGTTYTNSTGQQIFVSVTLNNSGSAVFGGGLYVNGVNVAVGTSYGSTANALVNGPVPANATYEVLAISSTLSTWFELR